MRPELKAVVRAGALTRTSGDAVFSHEGSAGTWSVSAGIIGMGPAVAREATERMLERGPFDHVIVVGIAGGLDPALPVGSLMVPSRVQLHPDGPVRWHPPSVTLANCCGSGLMTTDGLRSPMKARGGPFFRIGVRRRRHREAAAVQPTACEDAGGRLVGLPGHHQ